MDDPRPKLRDIARSAADLPRLFGSGQAHTTAVRIYAGLTSLTERISFDLEMIEKEAARLAESGVDMSRQQRALERMRDSIGERSAEMRERLAAEREATTQPQ